MSFLNQVNIWHSLLLDVFFPRCCVGCGAEGAWGCSTCLAQLRAEKMLQVTPLSEDLKAVSLFSFEDSLVRELIHALKYGGIAEVASLLVKAASKYCSVSELRQLLGNSVLVPIPSSTKTIKSRGYNQAELLAEALAEWMGAVVQRDILEKKPGVSQVGKNREERLAQGRQAFKLKTEKLPAAVILVDDVLTTGSTLRACAELLQEKGVRVRCLAFARAE